VFLTLALTSLALTPGALAAEAPSPSFNEAKEVLLDEQQVLRDTWHLVPNPTGYHVANATGEDVSTQSLVRLGEDPRAIRRVNRLHYASLFLTSVSLIPITYGVAFGHALVAMGGVALAIPLTAVGLGLRHRLRQPKHFMEAETAYALVNLHNAEVLGEQGIDEAELGAMLMRSQMLYIESTDKGLWQVHQGADLLAPVEFAMLVGDSQQLRRFGVRTSLTLASTVVLGSMMLGGLYASLWGGFTLLFGWPGSDRLNGAMFLAAGGTAAATTGICLFALLGEHQAYKSDYGAWYSEEEIQDWVNIHNTLVSGQAAVPPVPKARRLALRPVLTPGALGVSGSF
jgi:hypothetical protein